MSAPRMEIDDSQMTVGRDHAAMLERHVVQNDGREWQVEAAKMLDVGVVEAGHTAVVAVTLYHVTPRFGLHVGLAYSLSATSARETAEALIRAAERLEADAREQASAALRRASGR